MHFRISLGSHKSKSRKHQAPSSPLRHPILETKSTHTYATLIMAGTAFECHAHASLNNSFSHQGHVLYSLPSDRPAFHWSSELLLKLRLDSVRIKPAYGIQIRHARKHMYQTIDPAAIQNADMDGNTRGRSTDGAWCKCRINDEQNRCRQPRRLDLPRRVQVQRSLFLRPRRASSMLIGSSAVRVGCPRNGNGSE